jgi:hypothetical protein
MPSPREFKTVQSRMLTYAQEIGWRYVPRDGASEGAGSVRQECSKISRRRDKMLSPNGWQIETVPRVDAKVSTVANTGTA